MNYNAIIEAVKKAASEYKLEEYELSLGSGEDIGCSTFRDEIDEFSSSTFQSLLFRCVKDGKLGYATTQRTDSEEINELVRRAAENAQVSEKDDKAIIYDGSGEYKKVTNKVLPLPSASDIKKLALDSRETLYTADSSVTDGTSCGASASFSDLLLFNSKGLHLESHAGGTGVYMYAVVSGKEGEDPETSFKLEYKDPCGFDRKAMADYVITKAKKKFGAGHVKTGRYNIVFDRDCMAEIFGTFKSVFYADSIQKGFSKLNKSAVGSKIASDAVTITDDPFFPENTMQIPFDGEGFPAYTKNIIENGVLKTLLYNLSSAAKDGVTSTGNAARSGSDIGTKTFTFYLKPGTKCDDEIIKDAGSGIFVTGMKGFHAGADTISGDFSIESEGFMIEDGKQGKPVRSFTVSGNFFELIKSIKEVSSEYETGMPGYSQIFSPAVLIENMSVAGE